MLRRTATFVPAGSGVSAREIAGMLGRSQLCTTDFGGDSHVDLVMLISKVQFYSIVNHSTKEYALCVQFDHTRLIRLYNRWA